VPQHDDIIRESFTIQAAAFASNPWVTDEKRIRRLIGAAQLQGHERVLEVATGPGYIAEAFAREAREVVGLDLTEAMLAIARERAEQCGLKNLSFRIGDAQNLPFKHPEFDLVVCRLALHHMRSPAHVLREMAGACRAGGTVLVEDIFASEHPERAAYQNRWESLRDPSHVRALPLSELLQLFRDAGLEIKWVTTVDDVIPDVERWLATTQTPSDRAAEVRRMLNDDRVHDLSGTRPFLDADGCLRFHARAAIVSGRKLSPPHR
jgi:SAM-dependent methyltransferase